jgi:hypothetical protein
LNLIQINPLENHCSYGLKPVGPNSAGLGSPYGKTGGVLQGAVVAAPANPAIVGGEGVLGSGARGAGRHGEPILGFRAGRCSPEADVRGDTLRWVRLDGGRPMERQ